jgi:hypothetical protein
MLTINININITPQKTFNPLKKGLILILKIKFFTLPYLLLIREVFL